MDDERRAGSRTRATARVALAVFLLTAGVGHFVAHDEFLQQTPPWLPARSAIVWVSGIVEIGLALALLVARRHRRRVGWAVAGFFVLVFPGNVHQAVAGNEAFGLQTAGARWARLAFQPLLIAWAWWCTRE
jgi:uncharacterized membrane protein